MSCSTGTYLAVMIAWLVSPLMILVCSWSVSMAPSTGGSGSCMILCLNCTTDINNLNGYLSAPHTLNPGTTATFSSCSLVLDTSKLNTLSNSSTSNSVQSSSIVSDHTKF